MDPRFKNAEERLDKALARVDAMLSVGDSGYGTASHISALRTENEALRARQGEIAGRLDDAIARLQRILRAP